MAAEHLIAKKAVVARRAASVARSAAAGSNATAAQLLQRHAGSQGAQAIVARSAASAAPQVRETAPVAAQAKLPVSMRNDPSEVEAEDFGKTVARMPDPAPAASAPAAPIQRRIARVQRAASGPGTAPPGTESELARQSSGGAPLPERTRRFMEPRFGADFGSVRIHTDSAAAALSARLDAHAFTYGRDIYFAQGRFNPDTADGRELVAHELTHTIQQGAAPQAIQRSADEGARPAANDSNFALDYFAEHADLIPGFRLYTMVLGVNPINGMAVEHSTANIMRAVLEMLPGGSLIAQELQGYAIFDRAGTWVDAQLKSLGRAGSNIRQAINGFVGTIGWRDVAHLSELWVRAKALLAQPVEQMLATLGGIGSGLFALIKEAVLGPLAKLAEGLPAWSLLTGVLGHDPITGKAVAPNPEALIGGFMKLIGQEETWEHVKKANAIPRAWAWFQKALGELRGFVSQIPARFEAAFRSLEIADLISGVSAFAKIARSFGDFAAQFVTWAGNTVWSLLEIVFEVVAPGAMPYLRKAAGSLKSILKNPVPFVANLVRAGKLGFESFARNIGQHLKTGIIEWLTGSLPGVYIPRKLELREIVKFVLSVLGLTWQNIRPKLVKAVGETAVKTMETGFDIVVALVTEGPAAAWDIIKEQLGNLKDMAIGAITDFVSDAVVKKAVAKIASLLVPGGAFIQAIISIYDTVLVFIDKLAKIAAVAHSFLDSIMDIASGALANAASKVEGTLAGLLSLAISFFAGFVGLGRVADKVMEVLNAKVRGPIDKALDKAIEWIVKTTKKLFGGEKQDGCTEAEKRKALDEAMREAESLQRKPGMTPDEIKKGLKPIKKKYKVKALELVVERQDSESMRVHVFGSNSPGISTGSTDLGINNAWYLDLEKFNVQEAEASPTHAIKFKKLPPQYSDEEKSRNASDAPSGLERLVANDLSTSTKLSAPLTSSSGLPLLIHESGKLAGRRIHSPLPLAHPTTLALPAAQMLVAPSVRLFDPAKGAYGRKGRKHDLRGVPDFMVIRPGNAFPIVAIEATLDSNFSISTRTGSHKQHQIAKTILALSKIYPKNPIFYLIRSPREPGPKAIKEVEAELRKLRKQGIEAKIRWVFETKK